MRGRSFRSGWLFGTAAIAATLVVCDRAEGDPPPRRPQGPAAPATSPRDAPSADVSADSAPPTDGAVAAALVAGDLAAARALLQAAPSSPGRDLVLGRVLSRLGEPGPAAAALRRAAGGPPELEDLRLLELAGAELDTGDVAAAARTAGQLIVGHPQSRRVGRARVLRARAVARTGPPPEAVRQLADVLDESPVPRIDRPSLRALLARAREASGDLAGAAREWRRIAVQAPEHASDRDALEALARLEPGRPLTSAERLRRAERLLRRRRYDRVFRELDAIGASRPDGRTMRVAWVRAQALYRKRGRYEEAARLLAKVARSGAPEAEEAAYLHARALSRLQRNPEASRAMVRFVKKYPTSSHADEARLIGLTLDLERGRRAAATQLLGLAAATKDAGIASEARFRAAMSNQAAGRARAAIPGFDALAASTAASASERTRGAYWAAVARLGTKRAAGAEALLARVVADEPLSWYGLLARQRLVALGRDPGAPFGRATPAGPEPAVRVVPAPTKAAEALLRLGLLGDAEAEIAQSLDGVSREDQIALWQRAHATERLYRLARDSMGADLGRPPTGEARRAWAFAYPRPYRAIVEAQAAAADVPATLVWAVMRQESGFDADVVSTADARGLMQLLPSTASRVARELGVPFDDGQLETPAHNIKLGSTYLGALLRRYRGQAVLAIAAYNGGPHAVDGWLAELGARPTDELVERIPYDQTRNYVRRVTSAWARYRYLYEGTGGWPFEIPLALDRTRAPGPDY